MTTCDDLRQRLALGQTLAAEQREHVQSCGPCRAEAHALGAILQRLGERGSIEPSAALDRGVRALLLGEPLGIRPFSRPTLAAGLAVSALIALVAALAVMLGQTVAAERGIPIAFLLVLAYTTICAAATLPLLLLRARHPHARAEEVYP